MTEPVTNGYVFELFDKLRSLIDEKHKSQTQLIIEMCSKIDQRADLHDRDDRAVAERVLVLEKRREFEDALVMRRSTWISLVISIPGAILGVIALLKAIGAGH